MSDLPMDSLRLRPKTSTSRNYKNIQLHACLDEAKLYQDRVGHHFSQSKFQNHTLQSAERFFERGSQLHMTRSTSAFAKGIGELDKRTSFESKGNIRSSIKLQRNPEEIFGAFEEKTLRITQIKNGFDDGQSEKNFLKQKIEQLKRLIVIEKNRKAKVSLNNSKLMNANVQSNYQISRLMQQSRKCNILINEVTAQVQLLSDQKSQLQQQNRQKDFQIQQMHQENNRMQEFVNKTRRNLIEERKNLEQLKEAQSISYKQMTNNYLHLNKRKEEKALLLNSIEIDVYNNS